MTAPPLESAAILLVIAKQPVPGRVKTRPVPPWTNEHAASLAEAALADTRTGAIQRARLVAAGLRVADLPQLRDVDTAAGAAAVARQVPRSRFAARVRELATVLRPVSSVTAGSVLGEPA